MSKSMLKRLAVQMLCKKCGGEMRIGKAIEQTLTGIPDFSSGEIVTMSPGGQGVLIDCIKCALCGWSVYGWSVIE